jgi:hypothetical protein
MASTADPRDRAIRVKFRARGVRSVAREISFSIRAHSAKIFPALDHRASRPNTYKKAAPKATFTGSDLGRRRLREEDERR